MKTELSQPLIIISQNRPLWTWNQLKYEIIHSALFELLDYCEFWMVYMKICDIRNCVYCRWNFVVHIFSFVTCNKYKKQARFYVCWICRTCFCCHNIKCFSRQIYLLSTYWKDNLKFRKGLMRRSEVCIVVAGVHEFVIYCFKSCSFSPPPCHFLCC